MKTNCPQCGQPLRTADEIVAEAVKCPACSAKVHIPGPGDTESTAVLPNPERNWIGRKVSLPLAIGVLFAGALVTLAVLFLLGNGLVLEVVSQRIAKSYSSEGALGHSISAKDGYSLLVVTLRMHNKGTSWAAFSSAQFRVRSEEGADVDANLVGVDSALAPSGGAVTINNSVSDSKQVEFLRCKGKLSSHVSLIDWELGPGREYRTTLVYAVPADVQGPHLDVGR
jgi:hypothetical protein